LKVKINIVIEDILYTVNIDVKDRITINELIKNSVNAFNINFENENMKIRLSQDYLKQSKKNGYPKDDLPSKYLLLRKDSLLLCILQMI
jgi:hypothetical protein